MGDQKSLYALMSQAALKEQILLEHEGDLDAPEVQAILEVTELNIPAKVDGYKFQIDRFRSMGDYLAAQEKSLALLKKRMYSAADRLESNMLAAMENNQIETLHGVQYEARIKLNPPSVEITDENQLPEAAFKTKREVSLTLVKALLKNGVASAGARLIRTKKLEMRPSTKQVTA